MLEETRDTITVPATLMIRMLASLNQIRRGTTKRNGGFKMAFLTKRKFSAGRLIPRVLERSRERSENEQDENQRREPGDDEQDPEEGPSRPVRRGPLEDVETEFMNEEELEDDSSDD